MEEEAERLQEPEYQDVYFETVSHKNDCMNKIWTMLVSVDTVMLKGGISWDHTPRPGTKSTDDCWERGRVSFSYP